MSHKSESIEPEIPIVELTKEEAVNYSRPYLKMLKQITDIADFRFIDKEGGFHLATKTHLMLYSTFFEGYFKDFPDSKELKVDFSGKSIDMFLDFVYKIYHTLNWAQYFSLTVRPFFTMEELIDLCVIHKYFLTRDFDEVYDSIVSDSKSICHFLWYTGKYQGVFSKESREIVIQKLLCSPLVFSYSTIESLKNCYDGTEIIMRYFNRPPLTKIDDIIMNLLQKIRRNLPDDKSLDTYTQKSKEKLLEQILGIYNKKLKNNSERLLTL